jgi:hypothetical protein
MCALPPKADIRPAGICRLIFEPHIRLTVLGELIRVVDSYRTGTRFMGRIQRSGRRNIRILNEIEELREENRQLRELVAHLSKLVLVQIADATRSEEQPTHSDAPCVHFD